MAVLSLLLVIFQVSPGTDTSAAGHGWQGNLYLQNHQLEEAQGAYERGLDLYQEGGSAGDIYYGLLNNLGLALHGQGDFKSAQAAFRDAVSSAPVATDETRSLYNAGNNAFATQALDAALEHYRSALLADPQNEDARFNYEYVKRLQQGQNNEQEQDNEQQQEQGDQSNEQQQEQEDQSSEQQQEQEEQGEEQQPQEAPMSRAEAERILQALENEERQLLREVQKAEGRPRRVTRDW